MSSDFSRSLALLRKEREISQRAAAKDLGVSQALLSHYENGLREPGFAFLVRACDYYNVSADFLLGRTLARDGTVILDVESLWDSSGERDNSLRGSVLATLAKKLLVNAISLLFDLLGKTGCRPAIRAAADELSMAVYQLYRTFYRAAPDCDERIFSVPTPRYLAGITNASLIRAEVDYAAALDAADDEDGVFPDLDHDALMREYPRQYQSLLQVLHAAEERVNGQSMPRETPAGS